jgi:hypothetical protein
MATVETTLQEVFDVDLEKSGKFFLTTWTSSAGGAYTEQVYFKGWLIRAKTKPNGGGTQPSDGYDVTLTDADGHDVLQGLLIDRDDTVIEVEPEPGDGVAVLVYLNGLYTVTIANAGNAKGGEIGWYIKNR